MKKIYQTPVTSTTVEELQQLMAVSQYGQPEVGFDMSSVEATTATSGNLSRGNRSAWGDEEEEDF